MTKKMYDSKYLVKVTSKALDRVVAEFSYNHLEDAETKAKQVKDEKVYIVEIFEIKKIR